MNVDLLMAAAEVKAWTGELSGPMADVDAGAARLWGVMAEICDVAMPRIPSGPPPSKKGVYWWTPEIAQLRGECNRARRRYTHYARKRVRDEDVLASLRDRWRGAKKVLQRAIGDSKARAWDELVETLDRDPWGHPYKLVRNKLRTVGAPLTECLDRQFLETVVATLFPADAGEVAHLGVPPPPVEDRWGVSRRVSRDEILGIAKKLRAKKTAPGPDGVPVRALALVSGVLVGGLRHLFGKCLEAGRFPTAWKEARMVLLRKEGKPEDSPSAYRPICLLDEAGKMLERVLAARLQEHLSQEGPDLAECQFGFRVGRSTVDAIRRVRALSDEAVSRGRVVLAVSLDIANAFNTLPWECIRRALQFHRVPAYMQEVIGDYLRDRSISYPGRYGVVHKRGIRRGVPQGSVLGPLLWDLGYDWVLRGALLRGLGVVCYADDTLLLAWGKDWRSASCLAEAGVTHLVARIRSLGLEVALQKTEAIWFAGPRVRGPPRGAQLAVEGVRVPIGAQMKYLGLVLDSRWSFVPHFLRLAPRVRAASFSLGRLMPNLGGPGGGARRLYLEVVQAIAMYGAPVWCPDMMASRRIQSLLRSAQRGLAVRAARGYRTISYEAATVVAGALPWVLVACVYAGAYEERIARRGDPAAAPWTAKEQEVWRLEARRLAVEEWAEGLSDVRKGTRVVGAIRPVLEKWVDRRRFGPLTFRLVQVLTGHGCFGEYLHRIGREATRMCHHCGAPVDSADHTLLECPAWDRARRDLLGALHMEEADLSLESMVRAMLEGEREWGAALSFCEEVMSRKESAEREREVAPDAPPLRRKRGGRRARAYARVP